MKKFIALFLIALLSISLSCSTDNQEFSDLYKEEDDPKAMNRIIPPVSTMRIDFTTIQEMNKASAKCTPPDNNLIPPEWECIGKAWLLVTWSNAICYTPLMIPVAIYQALKDQTPTEATPTHVEWSYSYTHNGNTFSVVVVADKNGGEYDWDWSVIINDAAWITGGSMEDITAGYWQYHDPNRPAGENNTILVEWTKDENFNGTVKFTNNSDDPAWAAKKGDYILYKREGNDIEVNFYDINYGPNDDGDILSIKVFWNIADKTGGIHQNDDNQILYGECEWDLSE